MWLFVVLKTNSRFVFALSRSLYFPSVHIQNSYLRAFLFDSFTQELYTLSKRVSEVLFNGVLSRSVDCCFEDSMLHMLVVRLSAIYLFTSLLSSRSCMPCGNWFITRSSVISWVCGINGRANGTLNCDRSASMGVGTSTHMFAWRCIAIETCFLVKFSELVAGLHLLVATLRAPTNYALHLVILPNTIHSIFLS